MVDQVVILVDQQQVQQPFIATTDGGGLVLVNCGIPVTGIVRQENEGERDQKQGNARRQEPEEQEKLQLPESLPKKSELLMKTHMKLMQPQTEVLMR